VPATRSAQLFVFCTCFAHVFSFQLLGGFWSVHCSQETRGGGGGAGGGDGGGAGGAIDAVHSMSSRKRSWD
jgi:hypothetical protein